MEYENKMNLSFKCFLCKGWTILDYKIIYGDKEISFDDIQKITAYSKSDLRHNGVIQIMVNNKRINLVYPNKEKINGEKAYLYIKQALSIKRSMEMSEMRKVLISHMKNENI